MNVKENGEIEYTLYSFMKNETVENLTTPIEFVDYFTCVKQDVLNHLDAVNWSIMNCNLRIKERESEILLNTDFKELYGKANERVEKAHLQKENKELLEQLAKYKHKKRVYENQIIALNDIIKANQILLDEKTCNCET